MSSNYVNEQRRVYSLYVIQQRALPHLADGLKAGGRRVLWTARNGQKIKSATLGGATMPIHPHASPEGAIASLAAPYGNNIPLLDGYGAFGTLLKPTAYGAARYTHVQISEFTKDVVFRDIEIIPMIDNYDGSLEEPKHFLPLIPIVLLNPQEGIAVGFASDILSRSLESIIGSQLDYLAGKEVVDVYPAFEPTENYCTGWSETAKGVIHWEFKGSFDKINATTIRVTKLPYGVLHSKFIKDLSPLEESGDIIEVVDNSRNLYDIEIRFKKGVLRGKSDDEILNLLGLIRNVTENMNVIDFGGERVMKTNYVEVITRFTEWRLGWYELRYQRLLELLEIDIQRLKDVLVAIAKNVGALARKVNSRGELKEMLTAYGIVHIDYIADLPIYRFTEEEKKKTETKLVDALVLQKEYNLLIKHKTRRKDVFAEELKAILVNYKKGKYDGK